MAVLFALAGRASEQSHGYDLCRVLDLRAGTVYPILRRLDERGFVETQWEQDPPQGRPARHLYRLTPAGQELVSELREQALAVRTSTGGSARPALGSVG